MTESEAIQWTEKKVALSKLKPYERNPRMISKEAYDRLKEAIQKLGFHQRILCQPDLSVIGGHQRIKALKELGFKEIQVLVPHRVLTRDEFRQLLIQDNLPFGQHDFAILAADFEVEELVGWGMPESWITGMSAAETDMPKLEDGEKSPFQQMTFTLHDLQAETVKLALEESGKIYKEDPNNQNSNGNALFFLAQSFLESLSGKGGE